MTEDPPDGPDPETSSPSSAPTTPEVGTRSLTGLMPRLTAGVLLARRFRIVRFLAQGGMGEVYEAEDVELGERVALKTVRSDELAHDPRTLERFRREIRLARKVTHPNVCRTFDFFQHEGRAGDGVNRNLAFLTMELLEGETLSARLKRGPLAPEQALPLLRQIADALSAAHAAGVLHRDFKAANVIVVPGPEGERAVVTDFGLARAVRSEEESAGHLAPAGTPAYMSPEQIRGDELSPATDVYALGVVMFEMLTGNRPFAELRTGPRRASASEESGTTRSSFASLLQRLTRDAPSPRTFLPTLDRRWEAIVLRCLERDPADRWPTAAALRAALEGAPLARSPRQQRRRRRALALAAVLAVGGLGAWWAWSAKRPGAGRRTVAVLGFKNMTGRPQAAWLSTALSELLTVELAAGTGLRAIPGESVARTRLELGLAEAEAPAPETLARLRSRLGADLAVTGGYLATDAGQLRIDVRVLDTAQGEAVAAATTTGTEAEVLELLARTGRELRRALGAPGAPEPGRGGGGLPATAEAARLYSEGLMRLRVFDALPARDLLEKAAAAEEGSPLVHAALSGTWSALGYDERARAAASRALALAAGLPREERLAVEAAAHEAARNWPQAVETWRALFRFYPDDLEYGLRLAAAEIAAGRAREAQVTLRGLAALGPAAVADPRLDLAEAQADHALAQYPAAQAAAARAVEKGRASGARLLVARARLQQAWDLRIQGSLGPAAEACEEARRTFAELGDRAGLAQALRLAATVELAQGRLAASRAAAEGALAIARELGNRTGTSGALKHVATVLRLQGDLAAARPLLEESLALDRQAADRQEEAIALNNLATVQRLQGALAEARATLDASLAIKREIGDRRGQAYDLHDRAWLDYEAGELASARRLAQESLDLRREIGHGGGVADSLVLLARVQLAQGESPAAQATLDEAARSADADTARRAQARLLQAELWLAGGRAAEAQAAAAEVAEELAHLARPDEEALARALLARAAAASGDAALAEQARARAAELAARSQRPWVRAQVAAGLKRTASPPSRTR